MTKQLDFITDFFRNSVVTFVFTQPLRHELEFEFSVFLLLDRFPYQSLCDKSYQLFTRVGVGEGEALDSHFSQEYLLDGKCKQPHRGFELGFTND